MNMKTQYENKIKHHHIIDLDNTKVITNIELRTKSVIRIAIEIEKFPNNLNTRDRHTTSVDYSETSTE